jgi:uncharacterized protein YndB with AHSA1/START domain
VDLTVELEAPHPPEAVFPWVAELERYPAWLEIVTKAVADGDGAWLVDLRGRLGPVARRKRIRMARVAVDALHTVRFERAELDGREHAAWVLEASVEPSAGGTHLVVRLHYGGGLFAPVLEKLLAEEVERSRQRLLTALATAAPT